MNKLVFIGLIVLLLFGITFFAFRNISNERDNEPQPSPMEPTQIEPASELEALYTGTILEISEGSILTNGVEGISGDVLVHMPENFNYDLVLQPGMLLQVRYDGRIAESYPMQIWATEVITVESSQRPTPDQPEESKRPPLSPEAVRFTVENTIRNIHTDEIFELVLEVNPTTGYRTEVNYPDVFVLESDVYISESKSSSLVGAGSIRILQFTAKSAGTFAIECEVNAPNGDHVHTYTIELDVLP